MSAALGTLLFKANRDVDLWAVLRVLVEDIGGKEIARERGLVGWGYHVGVASAGQLQLIRGESYALHPGDVALELDKQASGRGLPDVDGLVPGARCLDSRQL